MASIQGFFGDAEWRMATLVAFLGLILLFCALLWSIRAWRRAEAQALESQAVTNRLNAVLNAANGPVLGLSRDGWIVLANLGVRDWLGDPPLVLPAKWPEHVSFLDPETLEILTGEADPVYRAVSGTILRGEVFALMVKGSRGRRLVRLSSSPILEDGAFGLAAVLAIEDVTQEEAARQRQAQSDRLDALGCVAGGVAREFNSLLAAVKYAVQIAEAADSPKKAKAYLELALTSVVRGGALTDRLLTFARRQPVIATSQNIDDIFARLSELASPLIGDNISFDVTADEPGLCVFADRNQLETALLDLILNARDAILAAGHGQRIVVRGRPVPDLAGDPQFSLEAANVYVSAGARAELFADTHDKDGYSYRYVELSVSDDGPGMEDTVLQSAVEPFFTTDERNAGKGLGLPVVYGFIQQANGVLQVSSDVGKGTRVRMVLPRGLARGLREGRVERAPSRTGKGRTVLIVENTTDQLEGMVNAVRSLGYSVKTASAVSEALELLKTGDPVDVLMTDLVLPGGLEGARLADAARKIRPGLPVLYMSGYTGKSAVDAKSVIAPVIQKPCLPGVLAQSLEAVLRASKPAQVAEVVRQSTTIS